MSFAESNQARAVEVNRGAGFEYAYSLQLVLASQTATTYTLTDNDQRLVEYDATGGGTLKLPALPDPWMQFEVVETAGGAGVLTVDGNGHNIEGAGSVTQNVAYMSRTYRFVPSFNSIPAQWVIVGKVN